MNRPLAFAALVALSGCLSLPVKREAGPRPVSTARAVHLARVRCLLVAPFENSSDEPLAAEAATGTYVSGIDASRTTVYPIRELRAVFKDTSLELPEGVSPSLALELAELIGADAALYGAVEGRSRGPDAALTITLRLAATGARDLLFARVIELTPKEEVPIADQVHRAVLEASAPMLERLGIPGRKACFDRQRTDRLRLMAIAGEQRAVHPLAPPVTAPLPAAPRPAAPGAPGAVPSATPAGSEPVPAAPALPPPPEPPQMAEVGDVEILAPIVNTPRSKAPVTVESAEDLAEERKEKEPRIATLEPSPPPATRALTLRQADWLTRLQRGQRIIVDDVGFAARSARLEREAGLRDVLALLSLATGVKVRVEGFVDASNDVDGDLRLSMEMARACGRRLIQLGVPRDRLTWAGRGGDSPILPNFTARGRMANRRIELVPVE